MERSCVNNYNRELKGRVQNVGVRVLAVWDNWENTLFLQTEVHIVLFPTNKLHLPSLCWNGGRSLHFCMNKTPTVVMGKHNYELFINVQVLQWIIFIAWYSRCAFQYNSVSCFWFKFKWWLEFRANILGFILFCVIIWVTSLLFYFKVFLSCPASYYLFLCLLCAAQISFTCSLLTLTSLRIWVHVFPLSWPILLHSSSCVIGPDLPFWDSWTLPLPVFGLICPGWIDIHGFDPYWFASYQ